ncbi:MAG TPA: hypothetical protein VEG61_06560 [Candidatus Dormibacteraeota bacterium]|nr:hypothetical protein [Candidatus Dormibacteraeota bacterium]
MERKCGITLSVNRSYFPPKASSWPQNYLDASTDLTTLVAEGVMAKTIRYSSLTSRSATEGENMGIACILAVLRTRRELLQKKHMYHGTINSNQL